jgi:hypothetical protein
VVIDRNHIVQVLRERGDETHASEAERILPAQVDPHEHAEVLLRLGVNPQNLLDDDVARLADKLDPDDLTPYA